MAYPEPASTAPNPKPNPKPNPNPDPNPDPNPNPNPNPNQAHERGLRNCALCHTPLPLLGGDSPADLELHGYRQ